ncbi:MAG TPA: hypothetical protein VHW23_32665 [Kofleriaceae bacterium]|jgi:hypothetical protein|nr:hypothetical protein [Kofleriaceae bacterium]
MRTLSRLLLLVSIATLTPRPAAGDPPDRAGYAAQCAAEMGKIPAFNCLDGQLLDITVNGASQTQLVGDCDKPVQLGLGGGSQCVPFSRLLNLNTGNSNVTTVAICRKYFASTGPNDPRFDDIAMIQHDKASGRTCFFQSQLEADLDGRTVPSPSDTTAQAAKYWFDTPSVSGIGCPKCHAADPFIWSSFVAQKADLGKWDPLGKYDSNFANMFGGFTKVFQPAGNACTACHRFGRRPGQLDFSCNGLPNHYAGDLPDATHPSQFLMPPGYGGAAPAWHNSFNEALAQVERCCDNPDLGECKSRVANDEFADDGSRYAAIWVKQSGPAFIARHGMTSAQYQAEFDQHVGKEGMCLTEVSGYDVGGHDHYAAIWEKKSCPSFVARHGMTSADYQKAFDDLVGKQGYRLRLVDGYAVAGQDRYAAIFEKAPGPAFVARHGMTSADYQKAFDDLVGKQGYCLSLVSGYSVGNEDRYAAIWDKKSCPSFVARHGLSSADYQKAFDDLVGKQGYHLKLVSGHTVAGHASYAAIFEKSPSPPFVARHGMTSQEYQAEFDQHVGAEQMRLIWVSGS